jgi:hypothetical protein
MAFVSHTLTRNFRYGVCMMPISIQIQDALRLGSWSSMVNQLQSHAHGMARLCTTRAAADLIAAASHKLCTLPPTATDAELAIRRHQEFVVSNLISSVSHADGMARLHPAVAADILAEARKLVGKELPCKVEAWSRTLFESSSFSLTISQICHADTMRRI